MSTGTPQRVAVVTGAGGGLARSHALELARQGSAVVVNDLAGAQSVVDEIVRAGGTAVASTDGVDTWPGGAAIAATAVEAFGRIDIVVNNAGILRDKSFTKLEPEMVAQMLAVHLGGAFHVTRAAWPTMVAQGHGRVVMTSSGSGLYDLVPAGSASSGPHASWTRCARTGPTCSSTRR